MAGHLPLIAFFQMPGSGEWIVILFIALLIFGRRLPEVARSLGKSLNEFKKGMREFQDSANEVVSDVNKVTSDAVSEPDTQASQTTYDTSPDYYDGQTTDESAPESDGGPIDGDSTAQVSDDSNPEKPASCDSSPTDTFEEPMS